MRRSGAIAGNGKEAGIGPPIVWSAAGHLLVLLAILCLPPGGQGFSLPGVVEVFLAPVRGMPAGDSSPSPMPARPGTGHRAGEDPPRARTAGAADLPPPAAVRPDAVTNAPEPVRGADRPPGPAIGGSGSGTGGGGPAAETADAAPEGAGWPLAILRERIQERIVYPAEAVRRGQEGEVLLRIRIGVGGVPREIRVAQSSGARVLDEAARRGVVRAAPLPSTPGWFEIPVRFSLR